MGGLTIGNLYSKKFKGLQLVGELGKVIGEAEFGKPWIVWGQSGSGKTTFLMQLAKAYMDTTGKRVFYNSLEEGASVSLKKAAQRANIGKKDRMTVLEEEMTAFRNVLVRSRDVGMIIVDSVKYTKWRFEQYVAFCKQFPSLFIVFVSHAKGKEPKGNLSEDIRFDSSVKIYTEGHRAFVTSRFSDSGQGQYDIWMEGATKYWGESNNMLLTNKNKTK